jgi:hypothetical protein
MGTWYYRTKAISNWIVFQAIQEQGGCFLSRLRPGVSVFWPGQQEAFDLLKELKKRSRKKADIV